MFTPRRSGCARRPARARARRRGCVRAWLLVGRPGRPSSDLPFLYLSSVRRDGGPVADAGRDAASSQSDHHYDTRSEAHEDTGDLEQREERRVAALLLQEGRLRGHGRKAGDLCSKPGWPAPLVAQAPLAGVGANELRHR